MTPPPLLTDEILDLVEQLEDALSIDGLIDPATVNAALGTPEHSAEATISRLVEEHAIEPSAKHAGYTLTFAAREGLRERWARSWACAFWPPDS